MLRKKLNNAIPDFFKTHTIVLWCFVVPQMVLIILNIRGWWLISGEADRHQHNLAITLFALELCILLINSCIYLYLKYQKKILAWKESLILLLIHIGYLWYGAASIYEIVPRDIPSWIIHPGNFIVWNFTFLMPAAFIALFIIANHERKALTKNDFLVTIALVLGIPAVWYLIVTISQPLLLSRIPVVLTILFFVMLTILFLSSLLRFISVLINWIRNKVDSAHYYLSVLIGVVMPIAGLALNRVIEFPYSYQYMEVYVLTVINGLLLIHRPAEQFSTLFLFLRSALFPFVIYFFLVYLPFMPLSLFAIVILGAGFLLLTPIVLFAFELSIITEDFRIVKSLRGNKTALITMIAGLLLLPGHFLIDTYLEKKSLHFAIDYFYTPSFNDEIPDQHMLKRASNALIQLKKRKDGYQLPYLSSMYNYIVFGNMVLTDKKIDHMYKLITNEEMGDVSKTRGYFSRDRRRSFTGGQVVPPNTNVRLALIKEKDILPGKKTVTLVMKNESPDTHSEYKTRIRIPEGIFITGLRLKIDDNFVDGRLFDRKTAMWVYKKIKEVRRDPALMIYNTPDIVELCVYPFPENGTRKVELDFSFPELMERTISIDGNKITFGKKPADKWLCEENGNIMPVSAIPESRFKREPYLHFIVDYSEKAEINSDTLINTIKELCTLININEFSISAANVYSVVLNNGEMLHVNNDKILGSALLNAPITQSNGFWPEAAIKKELLVHKEDVRKGNFQRVPVFIVITKQTFDIADIQLDEYAYITPDVNSWFMHNGMALKRYSLIGNNILHVEEPVTEDALILKRGIHYAVINADLPGLAALPGNEPVAYYHSRENRFINIDEGIYHPQDRWVEYAVLWNRWRNASIKPGLIENLRSDLLMESRRLNIMIPSTSFIVVENSAQWRILERKEKQSLSNKDALEFDENENQTPEPNGIIILIMIILLTIYSFHKRKITDHP